MFSVLQRTFVSVMISPIHRMSSPDRILQLAPLHCAYPSSQRKIRGPGMPHCAWRVIAITRCKFYSVRSMRCSMPVGNSTECQAAAIHTRLFHYCTKLSRSASSRFSVRKGWANAFHQPLTNTWNLDRHEQRHLGRRDPVPAKTRHMGSRGHTKLCLTALGTASSAFQFPSFLTSTTWLPAFTAVTPVQSRGRQIFF